MDALSNGKRTIHFDEMIVCPFNESTVIVLNPFDHFASTKFEIQANVPD